MNKITKIRISNYKSIKELTIPFDKDYGDSRAVFLLGVNESGKSNILEAINQMKEGFDDMEFDNVCHKSMQDKEGAYVDVYVHVEMAERSIQHLTNKIIEKFQCFRKNAGDFSIGKNVIKNLFLDKENNPGVGAEWDINISANFSVARWRIEGDDVVANNPANPDTSPITTNELKIKIAEFSNQLLGHLDIPKVIYWKPNSRFLVDKPISLPDFCDDWSVSAPLRNMFYLYGVITKEGIAKIINKALANPEKKAELQDKLSSRVTSHINKIWEEHKIRIIVKIDGDMLNVHVADRGKKHEYYKMEQRSAGFRQFISLLLTLSSQYKSGVLKNKIILLDEPEVHLHPSGVRFMRDEILKIGKDNQVFVATHSPSMVDVECIQRHWVVTKNKAETDVVFLDKNLPRFDDEVLKTAFGISMLNELLPKKIILVEGGTDKKLLEYAISAQFSGQQKSEVTIYSAGGASKLYAMAALLNERDIATYVLCDSDNEGKACVRGILEKLKPNFNKGNVFTLNDIEKDLPSKSTIEDTLPRDFVINFFRTKGYAISDNNPACSIMSQLCTAHAALKDDKGKQSELKQDLIGNFIQHEKTENTPIYSIATKLIGKINAHQ